MKPDNIFYRIFSAVLFVLLLRLTETTYDNPELTFEQLYRFGREAYTVGEWSDCVAFLRKALADYGEFRDQTRWCRRVCEPRRFQPPTGRGGMHEPNGTADSFALDADSWTTTRFMYAEAQRALCLLKCQQEKFVSERPPLQDHSIYEEFRNRRPYHYLQFCYWKLNDLKNAASSAYTFLIANPTEKDSLANLAFYMEQEGFDRNAMLVDLLRSRFEKLYIEGVTTYDSSEWAKCVDSFESAFQDFLSEWRDCRLTCEDHLDWSALRGANPELSVAITSMYTSVLRCRANCITRLSLVNGRHIPNFVASIFEYLHVCQYKMNRGRDACQSVQNALLLHPKNILTQRNKLFYAHSYGKNDLFEPTPEVNEFFLKTKLEATYLEYVDEKFRYTNDELAVSHADDYRPFEPPTLNLNSAIEPSLKFSSDEGNHFIDERECRVLERAARFRHFVDERVVTALTAEIRQRVADAYDSALIEFHALACWRDGAAASCQRGAFIINVGGADGAAPCGAIMAEKFNGCALVFCTF